MQWSLFLLIVMGQSSFLTCNLLILNNVYHFIGENKTWDEAQKYCREMYTDLATVSNMADMERLRYSTENLTEAWIGLHSYPGKGNRTWYWSLPGLEFNQSQARWNSGQPDDNGGYLENCVLLNRVLNQKWDDCTCYSTYPFVCYNGQLNRTFNFISTTMTWPQAQKYCRQYYTDLVSGFDQLDDETVKNKSSVWIGLFRDTWRWSDGSNFSFRNWESVRDLVDGQSNKTCATVLNRAGTWSSDYCYNSKPFFCYDAGPAPLRKHLVKLKLTAENPSVNMNDPAVIKSTLEQLKQRFRDKGVYVELSWRKLPEIQNNTKEAQSEAPENEECTS